MLILGEKQRNSIQKLSENKTVRHKLKGVSFLENKRTKDGKGALRKGEY